jgi:hypothetical protein
LFVFLRGSQSAQGPMLVFPRGVGEYHGLLSTHWFSLLNVFQAGLEPVAVETVVTGSSPPVFSV